MAPNQRMRALSLASAKHLLSQGHITEAHHKRIVKKVGGKKAQAAPMLADESSAAFGSLDPVMGAGAGHYIGSMPEEG